MSDERLLISACLAIVLICVSAGMFIGEYMATDKTEAMNIENSCQELITLHEQTEEQLGCSQ